MHPQRRFFDQRAQEWEERCYPPETQAHLEAFIPTWKIRPGSRVLDLGTGPGVLLPYLHALGTWTVALDISLPMLLQAQAKGLPCALTQADGQNLPLAAASFHHVICFAAFPHMEDQPRAVAEMARVLMPGGTLIIAHLLSRDELARHHSQHQEVAHHILPDAPAMQRLLEAAGLQLLELIDQPGCYLARGIR